MFDFVQALIHVALIMSVSTASSQLLETMTKIFNIRFKESQISWAESESAGGKLIPDQLNQLGHHCCKYNKQWFYYEGLRTCVLCLWRWVLSQRSVHLIICADGGPLLKGVLCVNLLSLIWNRTQVIHCLSTPAGRSLYCIATVFDSVHRTYFIHRPVCEDGVAELEKGRKLSILSRSWAFWSGTISVEEKQGWK